MEVKQNYGFTSHLIDVNMGPTLVHKENYNPRRTGNLSFRCINPPNLITLKKAPEEEAKLIIVKYPHWHIAQSYQQSQ